MSFFCSLSEDFRCNNALKNNGEIKNNMEEINMLNTALGAGAKKAQKIIFISDAHESMEEC